MKNFYITLLILITSCTVGTKQSGKSNIDRKVNSILSLMTFDEKTGQMTQYTGGWDMIGSPSNMNDVEKLNKIKNGMLGSMLNVVSA